MSKVVSFLDCGCAILEDGTRSFCPSCNTGPVGPLETKEKIKKCPFEEVREYRQQYEDEDWFQEIIANPGILEEARKRMAECPCRHPDFVTIGADRMAAAIDRLVESGRLDARSEAADARLDYGEPFKGRDLVSLLITANRMLHAASCPECDGSGSNAEQDGDGEWVQVQCQWCHEHNRIATVLAEKETQL